MPRRKKSRKRSGITGADEKSRPRLTYFVDIALGKTIETVLRGLGVTVESHTDHFAANAPDTEWIPVVAERRWVIVTKDREILRNPLERDLIYSCGACYACLRGGQRKTDELAANLAALFPTVDAIAEAAPRPTVMRVLKGNVVVLVDDEWQDARQHHGRWQWWRKLVYRRRK